jgi:hypothetical protein
VASRDRDDAMTGLLRRNLAAGADAGKDCPAPDILAAYFENSLDPEETARYELHFSQCARCREQLAAVNRAGGLAGASNATTQRAPRAWLWDWRLLAPAAAVLLFAVVWFVRQPLATRTPEPPLVAMSQPEKSPAQEPLPQASASIQNAPPQLTARAPAPSAPPPAKPAATSMATLDAIQTENVTKAQNLRAKRIDAAPQSANVPKDESADNAKSAAIRASSSETVIVQSAAPAIAPSARSSSAAPSVSGGAQAGAAGGVAGALSAQAAPLPESPGARKKQEEGTRNLMQQAQTQSLYQSRALALAADKEASAVIHTPDAKVLWRIASGGFVEQSKDGGATWQGQLPNSNAHLVAGSAPGPNICWLVGDDGIILLTQDASNWQIIRPPLRADFTAITAQDASSATVTAADGRKFTTTDRGKTWTPVP